MKNHDPLCPFFYDHTGQELVRQTGNGCVYCQLIARVREDERDCDAHGDTIRYRCTHYQQGRKDGYATALRDAVEAVKELAPMLNVAKWKGGYDCCGCSTLDQLHDDAGAAIESLGEKP